MIYYAYNVGGWVEKKAKSAYVLKVWPLTTKKY